MTIALPPGFDWQKPNYDEIYRERSARLQRLRDDPSLVPAVKAYYAEDRPAQFVHDWCMTFDPRMAEIGLPSTMPFLLFPKQVEFFDWLLARWRGREDGLAEKSRDIGMSWMCIGFACWMFLFKPGTVVGFGSRKEEYVDDLNDPKSLFWKFRNMLDLLPSEFRPVGFDRKKHATYMNLVNPEIGSSVVGEAGNNIGRGARTSVYLVDEAAFLERADTVDAALSQTSNCKLYVSTPNGEGNTFARKRKAGRIPVFTFRWQDDPRKTQAWYEKQVRDLDPVVLAQEVDISYSASVANAWIPSAHVNQAMQRGPADVPRTGPWKLGVDVARFGDDKTAIVLRSHRAVTTVATFAKLDTMSVAALVRDFYQSCRSGGVRIEQIAVDVIGIGAGVVDRLAEFDDLQDCQIVGVNSANRVDDGRNYNLRASMWRDMKAWLDPVNGPVSLKNDRLLEVDLTALQYLYKNGLLLIEGKEDAKRRGMKSPDAADAMALTFAEPVKPKAAPLPLSPAYQPLDMAMGY